MLSITPTKPAKTILILSILLPFMLLLSCYSGSPMIVDSLHTQTSHTSNKPIESSSSIQETANTVTLISPGNLASEPLITDCWNHTFIWESTNDAMKYQFQLAGSSEFDEASMLLDLQVDETTYTLDQSLTDNQSYYWRVASVDTEGINPFSKIYGFIYHQYAGLEPTELTVIGPEGDICSQQPIFSFSLMDADSADIIITDSSLPPESATLMEASILGETNYQIPIVLNPSTYEWQVSVSKNDCTPILYTKSFT